MSALDKVLLCDELIKKGWKSVKGHPGEGSYILIPPDDFWGKMPKRFYVYDAKDMQDMQERTDWGNEYELEDAEGN